MPKTHELDGVDLWALPDGNHRDGEGLLLQVRGESRSWILRYSIARKDRYLGLGSLRDTPLKEARLKAGKKRSEAHAARMGERGAIDPVADRRRVREENKAARRKSITFKQAALAYVEANKTAWSNGKHVWQWGRTLELYVFPIFGSKPVGEVKRADVLDALRPIWTRYPETARRVRGRIETVLNFAEANEWRDAGNPATFEPVKMALGDQNETKGHHPALPYGRMPEFMADLRQQGGIAARALEFQILTTTRGGEAVEAQWSEINWQAKTFTVPAARMKGRKKEKKAHVVPLSPQAILLLKRLDKGRTGPAIFKCGVAAVEKVIRTMNAKRVKAKLKPYVDPNEDKRSVVPHGIARSSFRTWVSEETGFDWQIAEKALAHVVGDETQRAYDRGDLLKKRGALMAAWSDYCDGRPALQAAA